MLGALAATASAHAETLDVSALLNRGLKWIERGAPHAQDNLPAQETPSFASTAGTSPSSIDASPQVAATQRLHESRESVARDRTQASINDGSSDAKPSRGSFWPRIMPSLVARDWKGAMAIAGGRTLPTDIIRLTRSSRMLLGRLSVGDGPVVPFAHVGYGEWRYDTDFLPFMPNDQEFAAQMSAGLELRFARDAALAWETDYTVLCRMRREPQNNPTPHMLGTFAALEMHF